MKIIKPYVEVVKTDFNKIKRKIEWAGRKCYKSEDKITDSSADTFIKGMIKRGHESVIEHDVITVNFVVDRGVTHELVRHRIAAYSQESTRYCNYSSKKFGNEITVILPYFLIPNTDSYKTWYDTCFRSQEAYFNLIKNGCSPQEARSVLPHSLKAELATTYNIREWRHFFKLRTHASAHPQVRQVAIPLLIFFDEVLPEFFYDIMYDKNFPKQHYAEIKVIEV